MDPVTGTDFRTGLGITGTDLSFTYFFPFPIFIFHLFSVIFIFTLKEHIEKRCIYLQLEG